MPDDDIIELPGTPGQGVRTAQRRVLAHIMHTRMQEMLEYALDEISKAGYHQQLPAGVILTGGGALAPGIMELAREVFAMPVRVGRAGPGLARPGGQRGDAPDGGAGGAAALRRAPGTFRCLRHRRPPEPHS